MTGLVWYYVGYTDATSEATFVEQMTRSQPTHTGNRESPATQAALKTVLKFKLVLVRTTYIAAKAVISLYVRFSAPWSAMLKGSCN